MTVRKLTPGGLPVYRVAEIPDGMATATMLRRLRRRPAEGQPAVALLFYHGNKHTHLYEIAAAAPMPALSPARQAAWTAARTCVRCVATNTTPWPLDGDDRRVCPHCRGAERVAQVRPSWLRLRAAATAWARDVLADPDTVLFAAYRLTHYDGPIHVHAATPDGRVLVDVVARYPYPSTGRMLGGTNANHLVPVLMPLVGRRLVHTITSPRGRYADHVDALAEVSLLTRWRWPGLRDPSIRDTPDDAFGRRWTAWHADAYNATNPHAQPWYGLQGLRSIPISGDDAAAVTATMRAGLRRMAADDHPDGPPACPWLPPTGRTPCGASPDPHRGLCPDHSTEEVGSGPS